MLVIRMQRTGRKGHAQFRVVVQDSRRTPTSGKIVASLGHFDPHTKQTVIDKEKAIFYLEHGAQPSERVARLLKSEGVKLPRWVELEGKKKRAIRNPEKLRKNRPDEPKPKPEAVPSAEAEETVEPATETESAETATEEQTTPDSEVTEEAAEAPAAEEPVSEEVSEEAPAETTEETK